METLAIAKFIADIMMENFDEIQAAYAAEEKHEVQDIIYEGLANCE